MRRLIAAHPEVPARLLVGSDHISSNPKLNNIVKGWHAARRALGLTYWSVSQWAKLKVKNAVSFIGEFEHALANEARRRHAHGVICGHIHHAAIRRMSGLCYINCGDWVESCTAVVEHFDGAFEIIVWAARKPQLGAD